MKATAAVVDRRQRQKGMIKKGMDNRLQQWVQLWWGAYCEMSINLLHKVEDVKLAMLSQALSPVMDRTACRATMSL